MNKIAALLCLLVPFAAHSQSPNESAGAETAPPASAAPPAQTQAQQPPAAPEMSPEEAAKAAAEGKLQYSNELTNPNEATAAEIAAHNATAAPDDRITCKKVRPTGSNRPMKFCTTAKQRREMREATQQAMDVSKIDEIGIRNPGRLETMAPRGGR